MDISKELDILISELKQELINDNDNGIDGEFSTVLEMDTDLELSIDIMLKDVDCVSMYDAMIVLKHALNASHEIQNKAIALVSIYFGGQFNNKFTVHSDSQKYLNIFNRFLKEIHENRYF